LIGSIHLKKKPELPPKKHTPWKLKPLWFPLWFPAVQTTVARYLYDEPSQMRKGTSECWKLEVGMEKWRQKTRSIRKDWLGYLPIENGDL